MLKLFEKVPELALDLDIQILPIVYNHIRLPFHTKGHLYYNK